MRPQLVLKRVRCLPCLRTGGEDSTIHRKLLSSGRDLPELEFGQPAEHMHDDLVRTG